MKGHGISDEEWAALAPLLPPNNRRGHPWKDHRMIINDILWILNTGAPWRDLPDRFGPWQTVYDRFNYWRKNGMWGRIARELLKRLDQQQQIGWDLIAIDSTQIRATRAASGARKKGEHSPSPGEPADHALRHSRGGLTTKLHIACTQAGLPLAAVASAGQSHESRYLEQVLDAISVPRPRGRPRKRPDRVVLDKGYSYPSIRRMLRRRGIRYVIPTKSNQRRSVGFDRMAYRKRNIVERAIGWLKEYRRITTCHEKLALSYLAMVTVAFISEYLDHYLSDTT